MTEQRVGFSTIRRVESPEVTEPVVDEYVNPVVEANQKRNKAEKEYFRNLSNRILGKATIFAISSGLTTEIITQDPQRALIIASGMACGSFLSNVWAIRKERFPRNR